MLDKLTLPIFIAIGAVLIIWYLGGNELMRRRGRALAVWCKRAGDNISNKQAITWYTLHSFKIDVEQPARPFRSVSLTGLTESWEVPVIWLWNRLNWRRDMVLAQLGLDQQPVWGCEIYRPRSVLASDARHAARQEGWQDAGTDGFRIAPAEGPGHELALQLLAALQPE
ncbi:MAG TPA: hypothetical protein VKU60_20405, partial [Chloroflexota bacterium]|nr:hypothetical protein [Chloroflexota bacterium]